MSVEPITCHVTQWYFKRMSLMSLMFVGFGLYFLYDGFIGYPKKNRIFDEHLAFKARQEEFAAAREGNPGVEWESYARGRGWPLEDRWRDYTAKRGWAEKIPEKRYNINEQFFFGGLCCALGLGILGMMLFNRHRRLTASASAFTTPEGKEVPFSAAFRIDKRKWANKGLAYVHFKDGSGRERRAVIDDLKYEGADHVLARLMTHFQGEILDRVEEPEAAHEEPDASEKQAVHAGHPTGSAGGAEDRLGEPNAPRDGR